MKSVFSALVLSLAFSSLIACSNMSDNSLLTDEPSSSSSGAVDTTPSSSNMFLANDGNGAPMYVSGAGSIEVTGDCNPSTYPSHSISAVRVDNGGGLIGGVNIVDMNTGATGSAQCRKGRFHIGIDATNDLAAGQNNVKVSLVVTDSSNTQIRNDATATRTVTIIK